MQLSFDDYRDKILSITEIATGLLTVACPAETAMLDRYRVSMARTLTAYHLYAERELFGPCIGLVDPVYKARVRRISAECATLAIDVRAFTRACAEMPVIDRWATYRTASLAMIDRIRNHLIAAEAEVIRCDQAQRLIGRCRAA